MLPAVNQIFSSALIGNTEIDVDEFAPGFNPSALLATWDDYAAHVGQPEAHLTLAMPKFFIVGLPKCGTTWLSDTQNDQEIFAIPPEKETRYYSRNWRFAPVSEHLRHRLERIGKIGGDSTLDYCALPPSAWAVLKDIIPELKIIFMVRDPVERLWSHLRHQWVHGEGYFWTRGPKWPDVAPADWIKAACHPLVRHYSDYEQLYRNIESVFGPDRILLVRLESIASQPEAVIASVQGFLGAPIDIASRAILNIRVNAGIDLSRPAAFDEWARSKNADALTRSYEFLATKYGAEAGMPRPLDRSMGAGLDCWMGDDMTRSVFGTIDPRDPEMMGRAAIDYMCLTSNPLGSVPRHVGVSVASYRGWLFAFPNDDPRESYVPSVLRDAAKNRKLIRSATWPDLEAQLKPVEL
jgi:hypothetical protein